MDDYAPNSHKYRESLDNAPITTSTKPKVEPVVSSGKAHVQKKSGISRLTGTLISDDAKNVKSYILMDVLVPAIKKAISDIITNGIDIVLYGESGHNSRKSTAGRVSYKQYYDKDDRMSGRSVPIRDDRQSKRSVSLFDDIIVDTMPEAKDIIDRMSEYLEVYPVISVADMYDIANITTFPHTYNDYGWKSVAEANIIRVTDGYLIKMPAVQSIR